MRAIKMTIRFKPSRAEDARALEYLQGADCSYSKAVVNAINSYLDTQEENREDSFLGRFRMMLREELGTAKNIVPFQPETTFPQQSRSDDNAALAFLDAFDGME